MRTPAPIFPAPAAGEVGVGQAPLDTPIWTTMEGRQITALHRLSSQRIPVPLALPSSPYSVVTLYL